MGTFFLNYSTGCGRDVCEAPVLKGSCYVQASSFPVGDVSCKFFALHLLLIVVSFLTILVVVCSDLCTCIGV